MPWASLQLSLSPALGPRVRLSLRILSRLPRSPPFIIALYRPFCILLFHSDDASCTFVTGARFLPSFSLFLSVRPSSSSSGPRSICYLTNINAQHAKNIQPPALVCPAAAFYLRPSKWSRKSHCWPSARFGGDAFGFRMRRSIIVRTRASHFGSRYMYVLSTRTNDFK